jgi:leucyl aminopeptidase (aminopeptidase T)
MGDVTVGDYFDSKPWRRVASTVLKRSLGLRRGQSVIIETWSYTLRAAEILAVEARRLGIRPLLLHVTDGSFFEAQKTASPSDANALGGVELAAAEASDGYIMIPPSNHDVWRRDELSAAHQRAYELRRSEWHQALLRHRVPSIHFVAAVPSESEARLYGVNLQTWQRENVNSSLVSPSRIRREAKPLIQRLLKGQRLTITHPNGTHLELGLLKRRPYLIDDGRVDRRDMREGWLGTVVPGGFTGVVLDDRIADGVIISNRRAYSHRHPVTGIRWKFREGRLVQYSVGTGAKYYTKEYRRAGPERDRPAYLQIGLNPEIHDSPFVDDQELGVVGVEIGHNDDMGGRTKGTFRQYALIGGADVSVDGHPLLRKGRRV